MSAPCNQPNAEAARRVLRPLARLLLAAVRRDREKLAADPAAADAEAAPPTPPPEEVARE